MKRALIFIPAVCIFLNSCTFIGSKSNTSLPNIDEFIVFTIAPVESGRSIRNGIKIELIFNNNYDKEILIDDPDCWKGEVNLIINAPDPEDRIFSKIMETKERCDRIKRKLEPGEIYRYIFDHQLEEYFTLYPGREYTIVFQYYGNTYNTEGKVISNENSVILSNIIKTTFIE